MRALLIVPLLAIGGCTTNYPGSPQAFAGINHGTFHVDPKTGAVDIEVTGGKEGESVKFSIKGPNGLEATYEAAGLKALEAQANQAQLSAIIATTIAETAKAVAPNPR